MSAPAAVLAGTPSDIAVVLVVAMAENRVIGAGNAVPWRLKSDLQHFRAITWGKPVVMGRKTFESINRALPGRTNIVVSRNRSFAAAGVSVAPDLPIALALARADAHRRGVREIAVIGGADIYAQTLPLADEIALTLVHAWADGETLFPPLAAEAWSELCRERRPASAGDDAAFTLIRLIRGRAPRGPTCDHSVG